MRILLVGAGGVGGAVTGIAARRQFMERLVVADFGAVRAEKAVAAIGGPRFLAAQVDASDEAAVRVLQTEHRCDALLNATDPRFVMPLFRAALASGTHYLDMAMSLSRPHPERPDEETGVNLGDEQFALGGEWEAAGKLALVGIGIEPGVADVFARYAADHLSDEIDEPGSGTART
jgi:saccharopine dehydrogenase (NAD+, L-lysine-forming)